MDEYLDYQGEEVQEVAEPEAVEETADNEETGAEVQEVAEPENDTRRTEADAAFAELRRRAEQAERGSAEAAERISRMTGILEKLGFTGGDADAVADDAVAHLNQTTVEEVRRERLNTQYENVQRQAMINEINALRAREGQRNVEEDLRAFRKMDPSLKTFQDLARKYPAFINAVNGLNPQAQMNPEVRELLFRAEYERQSAKAVKAPPKVGKVNNKTSVEKEYYTNDELDKLSKKDLDDPKILEKAMKSLTKLSK